MHGPMLFVPLSAVRLSDTLTSTEAARVREIQAAATAADGVTT